MKTLQQSVKNLEELFDIFNEKLFNNELEKPIISIQSDKSNSYYGWCTTYKAWETTDGESYYEINMTAEHMRRSFEDICGTLIHEMAHLFNLLAGIKDCNASQYHNKNFKIAAENHGLIVEKMGRYGYAKTELNEEMKEFIKTLDYSFDIARKPVSKTKTKKKNPTLKYVCPWCGSKVYSIRPLNITCDDCGEKFEQYL